MKRVDEERKGVKVGEGDDESEDERAGGGRGEGVRESEEVDVSGARRILRKEGDTHSA